MDENKRRQSEHNIYWFTADFGGQKKVKKGKKRWFLTPKKGEILIL
jgi:hypothetical protein